MANILSPTIPTFRVNGTLLPIPTTFKWNLPSTWGYDGSGQERFHPFADVELVWGALSFGDYTTLYDVYRGSISGTSLVHLPDLYGNSFAYRIYSGVIVDIPRVEGNNIDGSNSLNVKMKIRKVTISRS